MTDSTLSVKISNVGGIESTSCSFDSPAGIITGPNASNKTSILRAIAFGLGHPSVPIRSGADEAHVELTVDGETVVRTATQTGQGVNIDGDGLIDSEHAVLLTEFACLLEFNDIRTAVRRDDDYASLLKEPMNLEELERERAEKISEKQRLRTEIEEMDNLEDRLTTRRDELQDARDRVASLEDQLADLRERQSEVVDDGGELEETREERADLVSERDQYRRQIEDLENAVARLDDRIEETEADLSAARDAVDEYSVEELHEERKRIQRDIEDVDDRLEVLQPVLTANREMLASNHAGVLGQESGVMEDTFTCWACGQTASAEDFEDTIEELADVIERDKQRRAEYEPRLEEIDDKLEAASDAESRVQDLESTKRELEQRREERESSLETKRDELDRVTTEIERLDDELAEHESEQQDEATDIADRIEQARVDLHAARSEVDRLEDSIADLEDELEAREQKSERVAELDAAIAELTNRIENLEDDLRAEFNDAMEDLLEVLDYDHIERVWLDGEFELVIAREVDGTVRQDVIQNLSESERESVGLMLALAGYLAYDVADEVPVLLLDTLGAFDGERTRDLLNYFAGRVPIVLTALLPDSANAVSEDDFSYERLETPQLTAD